MPLDHGHRCHRRSDLEHAIDLGEVDSSSGAQSAAFANLLGDHHAALGVDGCKHGLTLPTLWSLGASHLLRKVHIGAPLAPYVSLEQPAANWDDERGLSLTSCGGARPG